MNLNFRRFLGLSASVSLTLFGCSTIQTRTPAQAQRAQTPVTPAARSAVVGHGRNPAADEALIEKFVDSLASRSGAGSQDSIEDTLTQIINDNASKLSISKIDSLDDIAAMSDADQSRIIAALATFPELTDKLALDSEAVNTARDEALAAQQVEGVSTEAVPNLQAASAPADSPTFAALLNRSPAMKNTITQMLQQNAVIQQKTGIAVLSKGCDSLENESSIQNMANVIAGVEKDVESGQVKDAQSLSQSLESNMKEVLGTDDDETHARICGLADQSQCGVFSPQLCSN